jgi:hypothetical protein
MTRSALLIAGLAVAASLCAGEDHGSANVTVLGDHDVPVAGARVLAHPFSGAVCVYLYALPQCITDKAGTCTLDLEYGGKCQTGKYSVTASKEADGYPNLNNGFFDETDPAHKPTEVTVSANHPAAVITVHLGRRAGVIAGTIVDAVAGKPLNAAIELRRGPIYVKIPGGVNGYTNAKFRILVPSNTAVTMAVSLEGYENWIYSQGKGAEPNAILLRPGEELKIHIRLRPAK